MVVVSSSVGTAWNHEAPSGMACSCASWWAVVPVVVSAAVVGGGLGGRGRRWATVLAAEAVVVELHHKHAAGVGEDCDATFEKCLEAILDVPAVLAAPRGGGDLDCAPRDLRRVYGGVWPDHLRVDRRHREPQRQHIGRRGHREQYQSSTPLHSEVGSWGRAARTNDVKIDPVHGVR